MPTPMQWAPVEHADEIEYETPCSLKAVESTADTVEPIERVTRYLWCARREGAHVPVSGVPEGVQLVVPAGLELGGWARTGQCGGSCHR